MSEDFEVSYAQATPRMVQNLLLPEDQDVELLIPPAPCLPTRCHAFCHDVSD